jgi:hypothetical protein
MNQFNPREIAQNRGTYLVVPRGAFIGTVGLADKYMSPTEGSSVRAMATVKYFHCKRDGWTDGHIQRLKC